MTPEKLKFEELLATTTMFFVENEIEQKYSDRIELIVSDLRTKLSQVNNVEGLKNYIREDKKALDNLLCLLNISTEKFKRIITLLRLNKKYTMSTEWSLSKTRNYMVENEAFLNEVTELILNGANNPKFEAIIPKFYLDNFKIDIDVISRLSNKDDLIRLVKGNIETSYNNDISLAYSKRIIDYLIKICEKNGLDYQVKPEVKFINREPSFTILHNNAIKGIIDISYMITTSSSQTQYARRIKETFEIQKSYNDSLNEFIYVMIIDGAGWFGRQSDFRSIHKTSSQILNLNTLERLEKIIKNIN
ncbi:MAG: hypothetical protein FJZ66_00040 [Bacteroidetes bacterium]|nr:hypothetical protein [Bacteroidota bacterium]